MFGYQLSVLKTQASLRCVIVWMTSFYVLKSISEFPSLKNEKGGVLIEMTLMVPFLVLTMLFGILETGSILHKHQVLTNVANNAARISSDMYEMQSNSDVESISDSCLTGDRDESSTHAPIHQKVCELLNLQGFDPATSSVTSSYNKCPAAASCLDTIEVNIQGEYDSLLGFKLFPISVSRAAPFLGNTG